MAAMPQLLHKWQPRCLPGRNNIMQDLLRNPLMTAIWAVFLLGAIAAFALDQAGDGTELSTQLNAQTQGRAVLMPHARTNLPPRDSFNHQDQPRSDDDNSEQSVQPSDRSNTVV